MFVTHQGFFFISSCQETCDEKNFVSDSTVCRGVSIVKSVLLQWSTHFNLCTYKWTAIQLHRESRKWLFNLITISATTLHSHFVIQWGIVSKLCRYESLKSRKGEERSRTSQKRFFFSIREKREHVRSAGALWSDCDKVIFFKAERFCREIQLLLSVLRQS